MIRGLVVLFLSFFVVCGVPLKAEATSVALDTLPDDVRDKLNDAEWRNLYSNWIPPNNGKLHECVIEFHWTRNGAINDARILGSSNSPQSEFSCLYAVLTSLPVQLPNVSEKVMPTGMVFTFEPTKAHPILKSRTNQRVGFLNCPLIPPVALQKYSVSESNLVQNNSVAIPVSVFKANPKKICDALKIWQNFYQRHPVTATRKDLVTTAKLLKSKLVRF